MKPTTNSELQFVRPFNRSLAGSTLALTAAILAAGSASEACAQEGVVVEEEVEVEEEVTPFVTGSLSLGINTHFISYGADVWGTGGDWNDYLFNPSLELNFDIGGGFTAIAGIWADVNDNASTSIGGNYGIQEIDVWAGVKYSYEKWSFKVLYQDWMYASQNEIIVDGVVGYDHWLSPSLTIHGRVDNGFNPDANGVVGVLGVAPGKDVGIVSLSLPVNVAFNTEDFHGGDSGLTYINAGIGASVPLEFLPGDWALNAGITYWHTPDDTVPNNPTTDFVTGSLGFSLSF